MKVSQGLAGALQGRGVVGARHRTRERIQMLEYQELELPADIVRRDGTFDLYDDVQSRFQIEYKAKRRRLYLRADRWVGHIPLNDRYVLDVDTRVPVSNIERILARTPGAKTETIRYTHAYRTSTERPRGLLDVLTDQFLGALDRVRSDGLLKEYARNDRVSTTPTGRLDPYRSTILSAVRGSPTASHTIFSRTEDTAPNRVIRLALERLSVDYRRHDPKDEARRAARLGNAYAQFGHVKLPTTDEVSAVSFARYVDRLPHHRESYVDALRLAYLIVANVGLALRGEGGVAILPAILIDMSDVFENYARSVLRRHLATHERRVLDGNLGGASGAKRPLFEPFDLQGTSPLATPDIVIENGTNVELVVDAKYKPIKRLPDRGELNQVVCYGERYGVQKVMLLYPMIPKHGGRITLVGKVGNISFYQGALDLGAPDLEAEEAAFSANVRKFLDHDL